MHYVSGQKFDSVSATETAFKQHLKIMILQCYANLFQDFSFDFLPFVVFLICTQGLANFHFSR